MLEGAEVDVVEDIVELVVLVTGADEVVVVDFELLLLAIIPMATPAITTITTTATTAMIIREFMVWVLICACYFNVYPNL